MTDGRREPPLQNETLHPNALREDELNPAFKWHDHSASPRSSQVFCLSAFGTLRGLKCRDQVLERLFQTFLPTFPNRQRTRNWTLRFEHEAPELLSEFGVNQPTSIDALCLSSDEVICIESKFVTDAQHGFGGCSQFPTACAGYHGPGSDKRTLTGAWCRLETWEGRRSPRAYWSLGRQWFQPEVFQPQSVDEACPLRGANYQLMRNFLTAASMAERDRKSYFGVLAVAPRRFSAKLEAQVAEFQGNILREEWRDRIRFVDYESYCDILDSFGSPEAAELSSFLKARIRTVAA